MDGTAKQTALFFGFLTAAMTYASVPPQPVAPTPQANARLERPLADRQSTGEVGRRVAQIRERALRGPDAA